MTRRFSLIFVLLLGLSLAACGFTFPTVTITSRVITTTKASTTVGDTDSTTSAPTLSTTWTTTSATTAMTVSTTQQSGSQPFQPTGYELLQDVLDDVGIPSQGNVRIPVFVIDFYDAPLSASGLTLADIETAFNGASSETAYESLTSYYAKSSFGKLTLEADVFTYRADYSTSYYENDYLKYYTDSDLIYEMLAFYDDEIDFSRYDANGDGDIDGVYVVYTAPVSYGEGSDLWWAYQDYYVYADEDFFDGVTPYYFCWSGTDFMLEAGDDGVDAHTIIHETGHMLGLDDYYDYDDGDPLNSGGLGGADMMDDTVGDHSPISKLLLGWIVPYVVTQSMTVDLSPYVEAGATLLVIDQWRGTLFDEYLLVSYYTPAGLFEHDVLSLFSVSGILIYHVDARIGDGYDENSFYWTIFNYNNTDTDHKFVKIIEADGDGLIDSLSVVEDQDLFQAGDVFRGTVEPGYDWYQPLRDMSFTITIAAIGEAGATITFDFPA